MNSAQETWIRRRDLLDAFDDNEEVTMSSTRFLTGSLATLAVASAITLASPSAYADAACGQPWTPAVYTSVVTDPVYRPVPAVTHTEWLWQRSVSTFEYEFSRVITPAGLQVDWIRNVLGPDSYLWTRLVVDLPATPAVPPTKEIGHFVTVVISPAVTTEMDEYVQQTTGKLRWESPDWGAQNGNGWSKTGNTRQDIVTPAVTMEQYVIDVPGSPGTPGTPAITHLDSVWATTSPGADWTGPHGVLPGRTTTETTTTDGDAPAGIGWTEVARREIPAVVDVVWAATAPAGYTATGNDRVSGTSTETTDTTSAEAPAGDGWTQVEDSAVTIIDTPASQELVTPGSVQQVLVKPAVPATAPCVGAPTTPPTNGPATVAAPVVHKSVPAAAAGTTATVLPNTGNPISPWLMAAGIGALTAGGALVQVSCRRTTN